MKCTFKLHSFVYLEQILLYSSKDFSKREVMVRSAFFVHKRSNEYYCFVTFVYDQHLLYPNATLYN